MQNAALSILLLASLSAAAFAQPAAPAKVETLHTGPDVNAVSSWIDADTGHRVYRLSTEPGSGNLYFHYNAYSPDGKKLVFNSPAGIMAADLSTMKSELIVPGRFTAMETSRTSNEVYYKAGPNIMAADLTTKKTRILTANTQQVTCINCDGTLLAGTMRDQPDPDGNDKAAKPDAIPSTDQVSRMFPGKTKDQISPQNILSAEKENRLAGQLKNIVTATNPQCLFTQNIKTGEVKKFGYAYAWLNHLQFSPTDPNMLMFCHEGTWHETNRVWTINVADKKPVAVAMHQRGVDLEIWGHEWWAPDGKSVGFDLQTPRSVDFWIANVPLVKDNSGNPSPGKEIKYHLDKNWWGIHFAMNKDGTLYASDGGDPAQVAFAPDGQWINLLRVKPDGTLDREKIVNMAEHNYVTPASQPGNTGVEPNVTFTPDGKYVVFCGNFSGAKQVYAVEVAKTP